MRKQVVCGEQGPYAGWWYCALNHDHGGMHKDGKGNEWFKCAKCGRVVASDDAPPGRKLVAILKCWCGHRTKAGPIARPGESE